MRQASLTSEMLAPLVPADKILDVARSRLRYRAIAVHILQHPQNYANLLLPEHAGELSLHLRSHLHGNGLVWHEDALPPADQVPEAAINDLTVDQMNFNDAYRMIWYITTLMRPSFDNETVKVVVTMLTALAKSGTVSDHYIQKVANGIRDDLNLEIEMSMEEVRTVYSTFGRSLTPQTARFLCKHLMTLIPEVALRVQLILEQAAGTGLTTFMLIARVLQAHPNFPWGAVRIIAGAEFVTFLAAIGEVDNNIWYGYSGRKRHAKAKNFPTLFYVCKEIAVKKDGERTWNQYGGGRTGMKNKVILDALVAHYAAMQEGLPDNIPDAIRNAPEAFTPADLESINAIDMQDPVLSAEERAQLTAMLDQLVMQPGDNQNEDYVGPPAHYMGFPRVVQQQAG